MKKKYLSVAIGLALSSVFGMSLAAGTPAEHELETVNVTAARTIQTSFDTQADVTVISRAQIDNMHYADLGAALKDVPGVTLQNYGASGENYTSNRLYINGSSDIVVLVNGMRLNRNGSTGGVLSPSEFSDMSNIQRIEVLKGSASTLYGADARGGVINIITRKDAKPGMKTGIGYTYGSYSHNLKRITNRGTNDGYSWMVSAQQNKWGNFTDGHGNTVLQQVDAKSLDLSLSKTIDEKNRVQLLYSKYKSDYLRPSSGGLKTQSVTLGNKDNSRVNLQWVSEVTPSVTNTLSAYRNTAVLHDNINNPNKLWFMDLATLGFSDQVTFKKDKHTLITGIDWYQDQIKSYASGGNVYGNKNLTNRAFYVQDTYHLSPTWTVTPGVRFTGTSNFGSNTSKNLTIGWNDGDWNVYTSYNDFFVAPSQFQLFSSYGSPTLKPAVGHTTQLGVKKKFGNDGMAQFTVYRSKATNIIGYDYAVKKYNNISNETTYGWSAGVREYLTPQLVGFATYTHTHIPAESATKNTNRDGYIPRGEWNVGLDYTFHKWNANVTAHGIMNRPGRKVNESKLPSGLKTFWLWNTTINYAPNQDSNVYVKVNNLFNKFYTDQLYNADPNSTDGWYSAPGRNFEVGASYRF